MRKIGRLTLSLAIVGLSTVLMTGTGAAEGYMKPEVVDNSIPKSLTDAAGDAEQGRKTVINRKQGNCLACHAMSSLDNQPFHGEVGPSLDGVSERYSDGELRLILVDSKKVTARLSTTLKTHWPSSLGRCSS